MGHLGGGPCWSGGSVHGAGGWCSGTGIPSRGTEEGGRGHPAEQRRACGAQHPAFGTPQSAESSYRASPAGGPPTGADIPGALGETVGIQGRDAAQPPAGAEAKPTLGLLDAPGTRQVCAVVEGPAPCPTASTYTGAGGTGWFNLPCLRTQCSSLYRVRAT